MEESKLFSKNMMAPKAQQGETERVRRAGIDGWLWESLQAQELCEAECKGADGGAAHLLEPGTLV